MSWRMITNKLFLKLQDAVMKIGACSHDPKIPEQAALVCTQCKGAVTVSFKLKDDRCEELKANKPLGMFTFHNYPMMDY